MPTAECRILCVDDHHDTSEMLKLLLAQHNYEVVTANTVEEAMSLTQTGKFDLFVLDKRLPDGSGLELCEKLNQLHPNVPCIFYSGDAYEVHRSQAIQVGADAYVTKPDIDGLITAVHTLLTNSECATTN
jgi:DNA-binding response OmpR family regulator